MAPFHVSIIRDIHFLQKVCAQSGIVQNMAEIEEEMSHCWDLVVAVEGVIKAVITPKAIVTMEELGKCGTNF